MSGIAHIGSMSTGHDGYTPRPLISGSPSVFVNGVAISRVSDAWQEHCDNTSCHMCNQAVGSSTVFINGIALARVGDSTGCGDQISDGSNNTFSG